MFFKEYLKSQVEEINEKFKESFVNRISEVSSNDFIFYFSKNKTEGLLISLNNNYPFLKVVPNKLNFSLNSSFITRLKNKLIGSYLLKASLLNDDNIISLDFIKTTDTYDKEFYTLIFEVFKANTNLIIISNNKIVDALHYRGLEAHHPIINGLSYEFPFKSLFSKEISDNNFKFIDKYILDLEDNYLKEKYITVIASLKRKRKTLINKISKLENEKKENNNKLIYKDYGDLILANLDNIFKGDKSLIYENLSIPLKEVYTPIENSQYYYKQYKKAKTSLSLVDNYINETKKDLDYIDNILNSIKFYKEDDYLELIYELNKRNFIKIRIKNIPKNIKNAAKPYYFLFNKTKIGFGKNAKQNNELTFNIANKNHYYLHAKDYHGPHVIIFNDSPTNDEKEIASELALYLANVDVGEVYFTKVANVKKTSTLGLVNLLKYETFYINKFKYDIKQYLSKANRF